MSTYRPFGLSRRSGGEPQASGSLELRPPLARHAAPSPDRR
ncbi:hypothetical protein N136_02711 [Leifsonia aquatica ATCC 14665]|uniref:Uncharacterized protein n=1 Tax=Leifsonia aquatica ATCC 14665 TaxID=1358026 RepID=U2RQX6_LEIAQ|nr:hypothetical protein N136_02711 [Leifsonia aquatica ATCC 14665]